MILTKYENGNCIQQNNDKLGDDKVNGDDQETSDDIGSSDDDENIDDDDGDDGDDSDDDDDVELVIVQDENCSGAVEGDIWQFTERHH